MAKARKQEGGRVAFMCPGCGECHSLPVEGPHAWTWNESLDAPTFTPSILSTSGHFVNGWKQGDGCWCEYRKDHPDLNDSFSCVRCHSFVTDGRIQFLNDCSHALVGQTVDLPDWSD